MFPGAGAYAIKATEFTNFVPTIITLTNAIPYFKTNSAAGTTDYYRFVVSANALRAQFEINGPSADLTLVARKGLPLPSLGSFDYISANPSTNDELIVVFTNSTPVALSAGDCYLSAVNVSGGPASYAINATELPMSAPTIITLTNAIRYLKTNTAAGAIDYYRFVVSSNSARAQFEINGPSADMTLVARKGLPLPDLTSFNYIGANPSTNDELIVVFTNSTPVALSAGDWYFWRSMFRAGGYLCNQSHRMVAARSAHHHHQLHRHHQQPLPDLDLAARGAL